MKNKKLMMAAVAVTMCAASFTFVTACNQHTHAYEWSVTKTPNCTEQGLETGVCPEDQDTVTRPIDIDPDAHSYGEWVITKPTYEKEGKAYKACAHNSAHVVEQVLPKLLSPEYETTKGEGNKYTYKLSHDLGDITFEVDLEHVYDGELQLVVAPTFTSYGIAIKACTEHTGKPETPETPDAPEAQDDSGNTGDTETPENPEEPKDPVFPKDALEIRIPMLSMKSDDLTCEYTTAPTETTPGQGKYTFKYFDESVTFDAEVPATRDVEQLFNGMFTGNDYNDAGIIGRVTGTITGVAGSNVSTNQFAYEFGDGFTHVKSDDDYADFYYYETGDPERPADVIKVSYNDPGTPVWYPSGDAEKDSYYLKGSRFQRGDVEEYGIENFVRALYNDALDKGSEVRFFSYDDTPEPTEDTPNPAQETAYAFNYQTLSMSYSPAQKDGFVAWTVHDTLTVTTVSFKLSENTVSSWNISFSNYVYSYLVTSDIPYNSSSSVPLPEPEKGYFEEALNDANPIKGYEDGDYYVYPGSTPNRQTIYQATVVSKANAGAIKSPYNYEAIKNAVGDITLKCGNQTINEGETVVGNTRETTSFTIANIPEKIPSSLIDVKVYLVTGSGANEEETELSYYSGDGGLIKIGNGASFSLRARRKTEDFKVRVKVNGSSFDFVYRNEAGEPVELTSQVTAYSPASDDLATTDNVSSFAVYEGEDFFINAFAPLYDGDTVVDGTFKAFLDGTELTAERGENGIPCKIDAAGEYTITIQSVKKPSVEQSITLTVKAKPDMATVFEGTYVNGTKTIEFKEDNKVIINDGQATVTYTYAYDEGAMTATLSDPTGGTHNYSYSLVVTPAYGIALKFGNTRELYFKGAKAEDLLAGTKWMTANKDTYIVFIDSTSGFASTSNKDEGDSNDCLFTYTLTYVDNGKYNIAFEQNGDMCLPYAGGFDLDFASNGSYIVSDGEEIVGFKFNYCPDPGAGAKIVDLNKVLTPVQQAQKALAGTKWNYYSTYITFIDETTGFASTDGDRALPTLNDCAFTYELIEGEDGKLLFKFTQNGMGSTTVGGFDMWGAPDCFANQGSYVKVADGKITEFKFNYYSESSGGAELKDFELIKKPAQLLSEKKWSHESTYITFYEDGTGFASESDHDEANPNFDCLFKYTLNDSIGGGYYMLSFELNGTCQSWAGGFDPNSASNGSYIVIEDNKITSFQFKYDPSGNGGSLVELVKKGEEGNPLTAVYEALAGSTWTYGEGEAQTYLTLKADGTGFASTEKKAEGVTGVDYFFHYSIATSGNSYTIVFSQDMSDSQSSGRRGPNFNVDLASTGEDNGEPAGFSYDETDGVTGFKLYAYDTDGNAVILYTLAKAE